MGALLGLGDQVIDAAGGGELAHGGLVQSQLAADAALDSPWAWQLLDRVVVLAHPGDDLLLCLGCTDLRRRLGWLARALACPGERGGY